MSEENKFKNNDGSDGFVDTFLVDLIMTTNNSQSTDKSGFIEVTVSVKGTLYSGYIIGGAAWCDLSTEYVKSVAANDRVYQEMKKYYAEIKEAHYTTEALAEYKEKGMNPVYLHMIVKSRLSNGTPVDKLWRFKACEVEGVSLGYLN